MATRDTIFAAAERYAAKLHANDRRGPCAYTVELCKHARLRGWARIVRTTDAGLCTVAFVGLASSGVYTVKGENQYGDRVGNVFALADVDPAKRSA